MIRHILICFFFVASHHAEAQFDYFELIEGEIGDNVAELTAAVELSENGYVSWGLTGTLGDSQTYIFEYDLFGNKVDSNFISHPDGYVYIGENNNFIKSEIQSGYTYVCGKLKDNDSLVGFLIQFDENLDTLYTIEYPLFFETYFRGFTALEDRYLLLGDYSPTGSFVGSFATKISLAGEVQWTEILREHQPSDNFANYYAERVGEKYFISGLVMDNGDQYGMLSITDLEGNLLAEIEYYDQSYDDWSPLGLTKLANGELMVVQSLGYEEYDDPLNQGFYWKNIRLAKINPETGEEYWSQIYHDENDLIFGRWMDIEPTDDGGAIVLGISYSDEIFLYNYLMKIDSEGNEEWFQTYWIEEGGFAVNWLRDVEVAHDGGYIMAGTVENYDIDPFSRAWILKVDACGDTEWQDCQPLSTANPNEVSLKVYPNPSTGAFTVELPFEPSFVSWEILDLSGRQVKSESLTGSTDKTEIRTDLPSGLYLIIVKTKSGEVHSQKIQVH